MQKTLARFFPNLLRIAQISNAHCGPATLEMLLQNLGEEASQEEIVEASGSSLKKIRRYGMLPYEMVIAIHKLFPHLNFWRKDNAEISDLEALVEHGIPIGVEWQGEFLQYADDDNGHYSVILSLDANNIYIADPYIRFAGRDRRLDLTRFQDLWWDVNEIRDPKTGKMLFVKDNRMIFAITPRDELFPEQLGMVRL
jgi:predicted double-glycine peptidase